MKTLISYGAMAAAVAVAGTMSGQNEIHDGSSSASGYIQTSKLVGRKVKSSGGKEIGIIKEVVIDRSNGCMAYTVLSIGGEGTDVIGGGGRFVALPWAVYSPTSDLSVLTVNVDREKIYNAPAFDYTRMDEYARPDYMDNVYSYYGVSSGPRTAGATGTDVTGTAGATASPGEVAPPAAGGTGSPNKRSSARRDGSSAANSYGPSKENSSPKATRSARAIGERPSDDRDDTASSMTNEKSLSESAASPNKNKKSARKTIEGNSIRPSETPESTEGQH